MKRFTCAVAFLFMILLVSKAQEVPIIETTIINTYSFTDAELAINTEFWELHDKYMSLLYGDESDKDKIPQKDRERLEWLSKHRTVSEEGREDPSDDVPIWSTDPIGCSWYCGGYHFQTVSSSLPSVGNNNYGAESIFDWDVRTAWVEGSKGYGIGEYVEVHFPMGNARATSCLIVNGYNKDERTWKNNSRVKTMNLYIDDKLVGIVNLKDTRDEQVFRLPDTIPNFSDTTAFKIMEVESSKYKVSTLKFLITDVYKGDKYDDTAISELSFDGIGVHCLAEGTAVTVSSDSIVRIENVKVGDSLLTYDIDKDQYIMSAVTRIHSVYHEDLYQITLSNQEKITVTDDHPFYSSEGWLSINPSKTKLYKTYYNSSVNPLTLGSELLRGIKVVDISPVKGLIKTYTLEFENNKVAFIANGILVGQE